MPARESLGWFTRPGDCEALAEWVQKTRTGRLAVSLDMLCFGGLVASRALKTDLDRALQRVSALRDVRKNRPDAVIFAFSTIARLGKTVACSDDLQEHLLLRNYSQLLDRVQRLGEQEARAELAAVEDKLDPDALAEYREVRRRNHAVNRAAVQLAAEGVLDYLVLAQEDSAPVGIHIPEQIALRDQIQEFRVADRVAMTCGADEMGLLLLARHISQTAAGPIGIAADFAAEGGGDLIPAFESQPLRQTVEGHTGIAGAKLETPGRAQAMLFLHTPIGAQADIAAAPPPGRAPSLARQADSVTDRVESAASGGLLVGLADVAYCNGADPELICSLQRRQAGRRLDAFAGWNTAANTVGTVIGLLCATATGGSRGLSAGRRFLAARFLDDYAYQSCVRQKATEQARQAGADPLALGDAYADLEQFVRSELDPLAHELYSGLLADVARDDPSLRVSLPWRRLFEVELEPGCSAEPKNL